ncbi:hypothetical protein Trydic_g19161 [Trypoxylus dichotomus]
MKYIFLFWCYVISRVGSDNIIDVDDILSENFMPSTLLLLENPETRTFHNVTSDIHFEDNDVTGTIKEAISLMGFHRSKINEYLCRNFLAKEIVAEMSAPKIRRRLGISDDSKGNAVKEDMINDEGSKNYQNWLTNIIRTSPPDLSPYGIFNPYVESNNKKYPAMVISGLVSVTTIEVDPDSDKKLCLRLLSDEDVCFPVALTIDSSEIDDLLFLSVRIHPGLSLFLSLYNTSHNRQCQALSVNHAPIPMTVKMDGSIVCSGCQHVDVVLCMYEYMGLLVHGNTLLPFAKLLNIAETTLGDDRDPQYFNDTEDTADDLRSGGNNIANHILLFLKDMTLLHISSIVFTSFSLCNPILCYTF